MWLRKPLDDILSSAAKVAVLRVVLRVSTPLSGREIARRAGVGYSPAYNALQALVASRVLAKEDHGRATAYSLVDPQSSTARTSRRKDACGTHVSLWPRHTDWPSPGT